MEPRARLALSALDVICLRFSSSLSGGFDSRYFPTYFFAVKGGGKVGHVGGSISGSPLMMCGSSRQSGRACLVALLTCRGMQSVLPLNKRMRRFVQSIIMPASGPCRGD